VLFLASQSYQSNIVVTWRDVKGSAKCQCLNSQHQTTNKWSVDKNNRMPITN